MGVGNRLLAFSRHCFSTFFSLLHQLCVQALRPLEYGQQETSRKMWSIRACRLYAGSKSPTDVSATTVPELHKCLPEGHDMNDNVRVDKSEVQSATNSQQLRSAKVVNKSLERNSCWTSMRSPARNIPVYRSRHLLRKRMIANQGANAGGALPLHYFVDQRGRLNLRPSLPILTATDIHNRTLMSPSFSPVLGAAADQSPVMDHTLMIPTPSNPYNSSSSSRVSSFGAHSPTALLAASSHPLRQPSRLCDHACKDHGEIAKTLHDVQSDHMGALLPDAHRATLLDEPKPYALDHQPKPCALDQPKPCALQATCCCSKVVLRLIVVKEGSVTNYVDHDYESVEYSPCNEPGTVTQEIIPGCESSLDSRTPKPAVLLEECCTMQQCICYNINPPQDLLQHIGGSCDTTVQNLVAATPDQ